MNVTNNNKISLMDAMLIYAGAVYIPGTRILYKTVLLSNQAAWLSPVANLIVYIPLMYVLCRVMKAFEGQSLYQIMRRVFGKFIGIILAVALTLLMFVLLSMFIRYAANTIVMTTYTGMDIRVFLFVATAVTAIMLRSGLPTFSRMATVIFGVGLLQFFIILVFLFIEFDGRNVTPISTQDIVPVLGSIVQPLTISSGISFIFVFNDQIRFGKKYGRKFVYTGAFITVAGIALILAVLGMFGADIVNKLQLPFHTAVENISVFGGETIVASLFILVWTSYEFVLGSLLAYMVVRLLREIFGLKREVPLLTAVMGLTFVFSTYFCADIFELDTFSRYIEPWFIQSLSLGIPFALFITAKARKMLPPLPKRQRRVKQPQT